MNKLFSIAFVALFMVLATTGVYAKSDKAQGPKTELPKTVVGTLTSVDTTAGTVTLDAKKKGTVTVTVSSTTAVVDSQGNVITLSEVTAGDKVKVQGTATKGTLSFTSVKQVKDLNLPVLTPTPTP